VSKRQNLVVFHFDENGSLIATLADVSALKISRVENVRMFIQDFEGMDMAKRPVLIATLHKFRERAGSVVVVSGAIVTGGV
jgi:hypothetical protein